MATYIDWMQSCSLITMTSHPALSLPCGFTPEGLPVGAQIVGRYRGEADLLAFAAAWEGRPRHLHPPPRPGACRHVGLTAPSPAPGVTMKDRNTVETGEEDGLDHGQVSGGN